MTHHTVAIMQPYVFPYLGYYQLAHCADHFVFYDDVQFIKRGWINRNRISQKGKDTLFTLPVQGGSQQVRICDVTNTADDKWIRKFSTQLQHEYTKAPYFAEVRDLVLGCLEQGKNQPISELAALSVTAVMERLGLDFQTTRSSQSFAETVELKRADRLIAITQALGGSHYVNLPGGMTLYSTQEFAKQGVDLRFIFEKTTRYKQFDYEFLPKLSIIDVMMHTDPATLRHMLAQYELLSHEEATARGLAPKSEA